VIVLAGVERDVGATADVEVPFPVAVEVILGERTAVKGATGVPEV
jgi:hypothetical protein